MGLGLANPLKAGGDTTCLIEILHHTDNIHTHHPNCSYKHHGMDCSGLQRLLKVRGIQFDTIRTILPARYQTGWDGENNKEDDFIAEIKGYMPNMAPPPAPDLTSRQNSVDDWHYRHIPPPQRDKTESDWSEDEVAPQVEIINGRKLIKRQMKTNEPMLVLPA